MALSVCPAEVEKAYYADQKLEFETKIRAPLNALALIAEVQKDCCVIEKIAALIICNDFDELNKCACFFRYAGKYC